MEDISQVSWRFWFLIKRSQWNENEVKHKRGFFSIFFGTLGAVLLGNMLAGKGINRAGEGYIRAAYGPKQKDF